MIKADKNSPRLLKLSSLQHLYTGFQGTLRPGITLQQLLHTLHPTPAVGGVPRHEGLKKIQELEPFTRGLYAAPWGWCQGDEGDFLVAIRSCLIHHQQIHLFAGSGLVEGSEVEAEWEETQKKLENLLQLL